MVKKYPEPVLRKDAKVKKYCFFYIDPLTGSRRKKTTPCGKGEKEKARDYIRDFMDQLRGENQNEDQQPTFREYADPFFIWDKCPRVARLLDDGKSIGRTHVEKSRRWLESYVFTDTTFSSLKITEIKRRDILDLRTRLKKTAPGDNTRNKVIASVKTVLSEAAYRQDIAYNPGAEIGNIEYEQRERAKLEIWEVRELLHFIDNPAGWRVQEIQYEIYTAPHYQGDPRADFRRRVKAELSISIPEAEEAQRTILAELILTTFLCSGMRAGELRALRWGAINFKTGRVQIDRAFKSEHEEGAPKWNKTRETAFPRLLLDRLQRWKDISLFPKDEDFAFATPAGKAPGQTWIRNNIKRIVSALDKNQRYKFKIKDRWITPHALRHTLNTHLLAAGVPPLLVQSCLGWSSEEQKILTRVQRNYTELRLFNIEEVAKKIDELYGVEEENSLRMPEVK